MSVYAERVQELRKLMKNEGIDAYIVLSADPHLSEYLPKFYKSRAFLSGFNGSVGTLVFTQEHAFLWVDGRYWLQAEKELQGSGIALQKQDSKNTFLRWIKENLSKDTKLGVDFALLPLELYSNLNTCVTLVHKDFIKDLWRERPELPKARVYAHERQYCSFDRGEKLSLVREKMEQLGAQCHLISSLDDIAWITNLRGDDVPFNPVFLSHFLLTKESATLFIHEGKIDSTLKTELESEGIAVRHYDSLMQELGRLKECSLLLEPSRVTTLAVQSLHSSVRIIEEINPSTHIKAAKTQKEIGFIEQAMVEDGVALCRFFAWLEDSINNGEQISERDIAKRVSEFRALSPYYVNDSFSSIVGFNANGALPHYHASKESFAYLQKDGLLLLDSGGQYKIGTTDITRVVPIGSPNAEQIHDYTLVLKAHIAISSTIFPSNIPMPLLDSITRMPLWAEQMDYIHGTGHGVGYFLNVHEGPQVLSYLSSAFERSRAKEGMLTSIEPGIYKKGKWGVRLENLVVHTKVENPKNTEYGEFLYFKPVTLCPFEPSCIDSKMLSESEKQWLNAYHKEVYTKLSVPLREDKRALQWLESRCREI